MMTSEYRKRRGLALCKKTKCPRDFHMNFCAPTDDMNRYHFTGGLWCQPDGSISQAAKAVQRHQAEIWDVTGSFSGSQAAG